MEEDDEEVLEDIPLADKEADPYFEKFIQRVIDGESLVGKIEDIEMGKTSRQLLYRVRYKDGHVEHIAQTPNSCNLNSLPFCLYNKPPQKLSVICS